MERIRKAAQMELVPDTLNAVVFVTPEGFHAWLEHASRAGSKPAEKIKGYKVKTRIKPVDEAERATKKRAISEVVFGALRRLRNKKDDR
jgi:hypothetical protein